MWTLYTFLRRPHGCIGQFLQLLQCTLADTGVVKTGYCCQKASFRLNVFVLLCLSAQKVSLFSLIRPQSLHQSRVIRVFSARHSDSDSVLVGGRSERPKSNLGPGLNSVLGQTLHRHDLPLQLNHRLHGLRLHLLLLLVDQVLCESWYTSIDDQIFYWHT